MKKFFNLLIISVALLSINTKAHAQEEEITAKPSVPAYVSEKGYWIVESNVNVPKQYTIHFYNNDHTQVYTEKVEGVKLKLHRRKVKMHLKQVLETSLVAWEKEKQVKQNEGWVINAIQHKQK